ncbi:membrane dipeptidase [Streptomyces mirabilis]|uniref:membrane dipeptidase n=1 Tax=Streptomyces mirabilis TaxID=68239 RepID=UPI0036771EFE
MPNESSGPRRPPLLWEQHCCLPLERCADVGELARYRRPGGSFVSVNVGYVPHSAEDVTGLIASWRQRIAADERLRLAASVDDVEAAGRAGDVAVAFDLEDSGPLDGQLDQVRHFYDLGVRTMLPSYNDRNAAGGGCLDEVDEGLTANRARSCSPTATPAGGRSTSCPRKVC